MNQLSDQQTALIQRLTNEGHGVRAITRLTGFSKGTVTRYRRQIGSEIKCGCGLSHTHKGWCKFRFAHSENRQRFMAEWVGWKPKSLDDIYWSLKNKNKPTTDECFLGITNSR